MSKKLSFDPSQKLKGVQSLTPEEQEAADTMQALKESKKTSRRQPEDQGNDGELGWIDSNEDEEKKDDTDDYKSIDLEMTDNEETYDKFIQGVEQVNDNEDEEMKNAETKEVKDDANKAELPPISSSLSISLGFGDQFLKLSFDTSLISTVKDTIDAKINSLLDIKIQSEVLHIQSPSILIVPVSVIYEPSVLTPLHETPLVATVTSLPPLSVSTIPHLRVAKLEKDVSELKKIDHSTKALATLKSQVPTIPAPESSKIQKLTNDLKQESKKSASDILKIKRE
ncbi:hypothetical protein Tco_0032834 [Tanacetum coccineum]